MDFNPQMQLAGLLEWMAEQMAACRGKTIAEAADRHDGGAPDRGDFRDQARLLHIISTCYHAVSTFLEQHET